MPRVAYTPAQMDQARAEVIRQGSIRQAHLATGISEGALRRWTTGQHQAHFDQLRARLRAELDEALIDDFKQQTKKAVRTTNEALDHTTQLLERGDYKNAKAASDAAKNTALVAGIATDKGRLMEDKPTVITRNDRDAEDILRSLNHLVPGLVLDSTAEVIDTQQLPPAQAQ